MNRFVFTNPLLLLTREHVNGIIYGAGFVVRQSFPWGISSGIRESFVFTPYETIAEANEHFQHIRFDPRKYVYNLERPEEVEKLYKAADQPEGYRNFLGALGSRKYKTTGLLDEKAYKYMRKHTNWGDWKMHSYLTLRYGVLSVRLEGPCGQELIVDLNDIFK
ncbi:hypothetical protein ACTJJB_01465 [Chitinophaga sp. 22536]|uniref:hypothetical protein n=1 Tax=unclassified Chitinophaga TaxID=2619133 RepID=UPI003F859822